MCKQMDIMERFSGWTRIFQFWSLAVNWLGSYVWQWGVTLCSQKALLCLSLARKSARACVLRAWARSDPVLGITRCPERQFRNNPAVLRTTCASVELLTNQPTSSLRVLKPPASRVLPRRRREMLSWIFSGERMKPEKCQQYVGRMYVKVTHGH